MISNFLIFSDAAKYADIARNLVQGLPYGSNFSFWTDFALNNTGEVFLQPWVLPVMPCSILFIFKLFGVSDLSVVLTSLFYYLLTIPATYLLAKRLFKNNLIGIISSIAVAFDNNILTYALSGASESPFIFAIVISFYLSTYKKLWAIVVLIITLIAMYFTRPLAFIFITGVLLFWIMQNNKNKYKIPIFVFGLAVGALVDFYILKILSGSFHIYSVIGRAVGSSLNQSTTSSEILRGVSYVNSFNLIAVIKNVFYNIYNFYKSLPNIINPYFATLFTLFFFVPNKDRMIRSMFVSTVYVVILSVFVVAASLPYYRYLHPLIPLIYIFSSGFIVYVASGLNSRMQKNMAKISRKMVINIIMVIIIFGVGQTLGIRTLDQRFARDTYNISKPPTHVVLSKLLKENTDSNQIILTNLDTWGSWYGERKTIWYPMYPQMLIDHPQREIIDGIYLTSYLIDDSNYYMGAEWREIYVQPEQINNEYLSSNFEVKKIINIDAKEVYENIPARAVLLVKRK